MAAACCAREEARSRAVVAHKPTRSGSRELEYEYIRTCMFTFDPLNCRCEARQKRLGSSVRSKTRRTSGLRRSSIARARRVFWFLINGPRRPESRWPATIRLSLQPPKGARALRSMVSGADSETVAQPREAETSGRDLARALSHPQSKHVLQKVSRKGRPAASTAGGFVRTRLWTTTLTSAVRIEARWKAPSNRGRFN